MRGKEVEEGPPEKREWEKRKSEGSLQRKGNRSVNGEVFSDVVRLTTLDSPGSNP